MSDEKKSSSLIQRNHWDELRAHTNARIALGRVGASLPTSASLQFGLAHAQARDAVHRPLAATQLREQLEAHGFQTILVASGADDRNTYLLRPDLGRSLRESDRVMLQSQPSAEIAIVIADGLSSFAIERHALPFLKIFREQFKAEWSTIPIVIAEQGRVAIGDDIGAALRVKLIIMLIGERPGLSSPDSLGIYLTFDPKPGRMDAERNCISNVRPEGLSYSSAAHKLAFLSRQALQLKLTGVNLKDDSDIKSIAPSL
ncbi:MAG: ethanolamine ammonia-lyase subunit EutC [Spongiibacteraceae bacterium]